MKLRPILRTDAHAAANLLHEGFAVHSRETWKDSVDRLFAHVEQHSAQSIGFIASAGGRDIGIGLAIPGVRSAYEPSPREVINLAAFYLRPGNEWMTTLFLRRMMKDPSVEYVDLTASVQMREVNRRLGFIDHTRGAVVVPTALASLRPGRGVRILQPCDRAAAGLSSEHRTLLEQHDRLGAISLVVEIDGLCHPLILVRNRRKRIPGARVILARDKDLLRAVAGPLSRFLLKQGILFLEFDSPSPVSIAGSVFVSLAAPVQSTWQGNSNVIDHTFSELLFIPPPRNRAVVRWPRPRRSPVFPFPFGLIEASITAAPTASIVFSLAEALPV
jgi:hypothetical protein